MLRAGLVGRTDPGQILHIVDFREALTRVSVCDELVALKRRFVNYYREVGAHIKHSVHEMQDGIAFAPTLFPVLAPLIAGCVQLLVR